MLRCVVNGKALVQQPISRVQWHDGELRLGQGRLVKPAKHVHSTFAAGKIPIASEVLAAVRHVLPTDE